MTLIAAKLLDDAWEVYMNIATTNDATGITRQTPSWEQPVTPYDFAAALVKSLFPLTYNYPVEDQARTERIWELTIDRMEIVPIDEALSRSKDASSNEKAAGCHHCGWGITSYAHYTECRS